MSLICPDYLFGCFYNRTVNNWGFCLVTSLFWSGFSMSECANIRLLLASCFYLHLPCVCSHSTCVSPQLCLLLFFFFFPHFCVCQFNIEHRPTHLFFADSNSLLCCYRLLPKSFHPLFLYLSSRRTNGTLIL